MAIAPRQMQARRKLICVFPRRSDFNRVFNGSKLSRKRFYVIDQNGYIVHTHRNDRVVGKFIGLLEPCAVRLMVEEGNFRIQEPIRARYLDHVTGYRLAPT